MLPQAALNQLFRGKFLAELKELKFSFPKKLYKIDWVVDCKLVGKGEEALRYLSRYLYRGVLSEHNIISDEKGKVTFSYIESKTKERKYRTLPGAQFLELLLKHVLPQGFRRVRDYGFLHGNAKKTLTILQLILIPKMSKAEPKQRPPILCPDCEVPMRVVAVIRQQPDPENRGSPILF